MSWGSAACDRNGRKGGWRSWQIPDHAQESGLDFKGKQGQFIRHALTGWGAAVGLEKVGTGEVGGGGRGCREGLGCLGDGNCRRGAGSGGEGRVVISGVWTCQLIGTHETAVRQFRERVRIQGGGQARGEI